MLQKILRERMQAEGLSLRTAADQIGVSHATLDRVLQGNTVNIDTLVHLSQWTGISLSTLIEHLDPNKEASLENTISILIEAEPKLKEVFAQAVDLLKKGQIDPSDLRDIASYAAYKLQFASPEVVNEASSNAAISPDRRGRK